jgi:hypothetical protein
MPYAIAAPAIATVPVLGGDPFPVHRIASTRAKWDMIPIASRRSSS